jgi:hypothetical protein
MKMEKQQKLFKDLERKAKRDKRKFVKTPKKVTFNVNLDISWYERLTMERARTKKSYKGLVEEALERIYPKESKND